MPKGVVNGFRKADERNLPKVDPEMLKEFYRSSRFLIPGVRNVKGERPTKPEYADVALGCCQVKREGNICTVRAEISPEQSVNSKNYHVICEIDEEKEEIIEAHCEDCVASAGGCKHIICFVSWLHRKSSEDPVTSKPCEWKRPKLSNVSSTHYKLSDLVPQLKPSKPVTEETLNNFKAYVGAGLEASGSFSGFLTHHLSNQSKAKPPISIHNLMMQYKKRDEPHCCEDFLNFCPNVMSKELCKEVEELTRDQASGSDTTWFRYRYARNTASKLWEISNCSTPDGCTTKSILGAVGINDTEAMKYGREMEPKVINMFAKERGRMPKKCGLLLDSSLPQYGASPDGILDEYVIEVKWPTTEKTFKTYFNKDISAPSNKCNAQIHLQMKFAEKQKGLLCVADWNFRHTKKITTLVVNRDNTFFDPIIDRSSNFWDQNIYHVVYNAV